jgi:hypothetical protein
LRSRRRAEEPHGFGPTREEPDQLSRFASLRSRKRGRARAVEAADAVGLAVDVGTRIESSRRKVRVITPSAPVWRILSKPFFAS